MSVSLTFAAVLGTLFWMGVVAYALTRWGRSLSHGGVVDRSKWEMYAAERGYAYTADPLFPRIRGVHDGVSFEVSARIFRRRKRDGRTVERAVTSLRVTHRAQLPAGLAVRKWSIGRVIGSLFAGRRALSLDDDDYDEYFRVEAEDAEGAAKLLQVAEVRKALLALIVDLPEAVVHERAIEAELPGMASDLGVLDAYLDRMAAVAKALRAVAPQVDRAAAPDTAEVTADTAPRPQAPPPLRPLPTAAELPQRNESLGGALRRLAGASSKASANVQATSMRLRPYEYELEVRVIAPAVNRLGAPTGGRLVRGHLSRSSWRAEITFSPDDNAAVDALKPTDVITGLALVDDLRTVAQTVECTAQTPPIVKEPARPVPTDAKAPDPPGKRGG